MAEAQIVNTTREHVRDEVREGRRELGLKEPDDFLLVSRRSPERFQQRGDRTRLAELLRRD